jgi:hypothetical protein
MNFKIKIFPNKMESPEIQHVGCNVCKPPKNEGLIQNPNTSESSEMKSSAIWIIIIILVILLILGVLLMRRNVKKSRK